MRSKPKPFPTLRRTIRDVMRKLIVRLGDNFELTALDDALGRCLKRQPGVRTVIDVGASNGQWTAIARRYFPMARYLLIEAQQPHETALRALKEKTPNLDYVIAAAGDAVGEIYFDASDLLGGIGSHLPFEKNCIVVPTTTIDVQVAEKQLPGPYFIKLDTHGFEPPILKGAQQALKNTALLMIETYNFNFSSENLRFHQMVALMDELGFRCVDVCDPLFRPYDRALWQFDLFFEPKTSPTFEAEGYSG